MDSRFFSSGIADPQPTPSRQVGSVRRTTNIDIVPADGGLVLRGACRDLRSDDSPLSIEHATVTATLDRTHQLLALDHSGDASMGLVGRTVGAGFRAALSEALPASETGSPLYVLLDELPVAAVISGYALMYNNSLADQTNAADHMGDICSGWRSDGLMIRSIRATGRMPVPKGPDAPAAETADAWDWHSLPALQPGEMRRRRLIDVEPDGAVFATFRDSHVDHDGTERVLHEYTLTARLVSGRITGCVATPRVLPWHECPHAAASAARLDGIEPSAVHMVMKGSRGLGTCTHLNDLLRSLSGLERLAGHLS